MRRTRGLLAALGVLALLLAGWVAVRAAAPPPRPTVVLISMDGVRWDYPEKDHLRAFAAMAKEGARAARLIPPFPSLTFASHSTLATGCQPGRHGIIANSFLDPETGRRFTDSDEAGWLLAPPLWVLAEEAGLRAAVSGWPLSKGPWHGVQASFYRPFEGGSSDAETAAWILGLLRRPEAQRPHLIMAWTHGADGAGHAQGPDGPAVREAMRRADALLAQLRAGIRALGPAVPVDLVLVSDHGMAAVSRVIDVVKAIPKRGFYPYIATSGPVCNVYVKTEAQRRQVAAGLSRLPGDVRIYTRSTLPSRWEYAESGREGDFILVAPPGAYFSSFNRKGEKSLPRGMHGWPPSEVSQMDGIFYAEGPGIPAGKLLGDVHATDVAPTVCALLGIAPPPRAEGSALFLPNR